MSIAHTRYIEDKVSQARTAIDAYPGTDSADLATSILDLIGDLMHLAEAEGLFADGHTAEDLTESGLIHFYAEGGDGHEPDDIAMGSVY